MKQLIKRGGFYAAFLAVALSACKDGGPSIEDVCEQECEQYRKCEPADFDDEYENLDECYDECDNQTAVEECVANLMSEKCKDSQLSLASCVVKLSCDDLDEYWAADDIKEDYPCKSNDVKAAENCEDEDWESIYDECYDDGDGDDDSSDADAKIGEWTTGITPSAVFLKIFSR